MIRLRGLGVRELWSYGGKVHAHASESASNYFGLELPKRQKVVMEVGLRL